MSNPSNSPEILIDTIKIRVTDTGDFAFGIGKNRTKDIIIQQIENEIIIKTIIKKIITRNYNIHRIDGLPETQVTPPEELLERIKKENRLIINARTIDSDLDYFREGFTKPVKGIITGVYGSQLILNGKPRRVHYGLDFAAPKGTGIKSMVDGVCTLSEQDLYYTGKTLIFDHGHGVSTLYMHMDEISVDKGQTVRKGDTIGRVGSTGRSTGAHLDIRLNWFKVKLDPASVLDI